MEFGGIGGALAGGDGGVGLFMALIFQFWRRILIWCRLDEIFEAFLFDEEVVVVLAEAMGFIANVLEEFEGGAGAGEVEFSAGDGELGGAGAGCEENFFFAFG